ncbi:hypothetical protein LVD15_03545 [Fulvivirga maritima]|uniref:hypothetical protein n=1 Tax=Fulvivirga maritima TaxID=2904247 RepID=UPI001F4021A9|nr:hypothetical protein [Fulvivirga maritima]UII27519.1 hypothetical protein LVD15_03545 [Fulvivirga maritima]
MHQKLTLLLALICIGSSRVFCQSTEPVKIIKTSGDTIEFVTTLRLYRGQNIFPSDDKPFIKGRLNGVKTKLPKSEVRKIYLRDGSKYVVLNNNNSYYIGFYLTKGKKSFFKSYTYSRTMIYGMNGPQSSANKVASVSYFIEEGGKLKFLDRKRGIKELAEECQMFAAYVNTQNRIKRDHEIEDALDYYDLNCN